MVDKMVSSYQTWFMVGRSIQDNIIVAQEVLHSTNHLKGKHRYFMMKIDLAKVYDMMVLSFIHNVFLEIDFHEKINQVIMESVTFVKMVVLWQGQRDSYFETQKGLRQGDLISLSLLIRSLYGKINPLDLG